jgi:hypothetical protein
MSHIQDCMDDFDTVKERWDINETAAALLVLAASIQDAAPFLPSNAERFGRELALALGEVLHTATISVNANVDTEVSK